MHTYELFLCLTSVGFCKFGMFLSLHAEYGRVTKFTVCFSLSLAPVNPDWFYPPGLLFGGAVWRDMHFANTLLTRTSLLLLGLVLCAYLYIV